MIRDKNNTGSRFLSAFLVFLFLAHVLRAIDLPPAPEGFDWQEVPELKAAFLKPKGWFFQQEEQKGTLAYFISKEDISKGGEFRTGLTVNVFHLKDGSSAGQGQLMIANIASAKHGKPWTKKVGPFVEFGCEVSETDETGTIVMHALAVANPKTNTLYYFSFESPEADWKDAWKIGKQMMDKLALNDEV